MLLQNWWYTTLLGLKYTVCPPLREEITSDVLIVGAGIAGLSAALRLMDSGKKVHYNFVFNTNSNLHLI